VSDAPAIQLERVTVHRGARPVLWDIDADVHAGSLTAIVGPNGAGKSTLLSAMLGLVPITTGHARVHGIESRRALDRIAFVPQSSGVDWSFPVSVRDVVAMGRYRHVGWLRRLRERDRDIVNDSLEIVGMAAFAGRQIGRLSGGQRQRVFLARALAQRADVLLLDEPFAGVDARTEHALLEVLLAQRDAGGTIMMVHHDLHTVRASVDRVLALNVQLIADGTPADVLQPETLQRLYGGAPDSRLATAVAWTR
jgi:manganese/zinc/iron transport system ATP- binding protein